MKGRAHTSVGTTPISCYFVADLPIFNFIMRVAFGIGFPWSSTGLAVFGHNRLKFNFTVKVMRCVFNAVCIAAGITHGFSGEYTFFLNHKPIFLLG